MITTQINKTGYYKVIFLIFCNLLLIDCKNKNESEILKKYNQDNYRKSLQNNYKDNYQPVDSFFIDKYSCIREIKDFNDYSIHSAVNFNNFYGVNFGFVALDKNEISKLMFVETYKNSKYFKKTSPVQVKLSGIKENDPLFLLYKFKILDTLSIGDILPNEKFCFWTCRKDSIIDHEIIGLFVLNDKEFLKNPRKVWKLDFINKKIKIIDAKGIDYFNVEYGVGLDPPEDYDTN